MDSIEKHSRRHNIENLEELKEEATRIRSNFMGQRVRWPYWFKKAVVEQSRNHRVSELSKQTGIQSSQVYDWRRDIEGGGKKSSAKDEHAALHAGFKKIAIKEDQKLSLNLPSGSRIEGLNVGDLRAWIEGGVI
jgi:transposase-like protein